MSGEATGLQAGTEYTYCLVATNSGGETFGQPVSFTTPGMARPETPLTESCSGPIKGGAQKLCGTLNPHSSAKVGSYFAYNARTSCTGGSRLAGGEVEGEAIEVSGEATGLQAGTEYTYCLVATNSGGETFGQPVSFTTPGMARPETPLTESCSGPIKGGAQKLCGTLNPHSSAKVGSYFAYNAGTSCTGGSRLAGGEVEGEAIEVSGEATGLQAGTEYTYCLVATNSGGETFGQPVSFTTPAAESVQISQTPIPAPCTLLCAGSDTDPTLAGSPAHSFTSTAHKPLTRAQKLARAMKRCRKEAKNKRAACEKWAHIRYGVVHKVHPTDHPH